MRRLRVVLDGPLVDVITGWIAQKLIRDIQASLAQIGEKIAHQIANRKDQHD